MGLGHTLTDECWQSPDTPDASFGLRLPVGQAVKRFVQVGRAVWATMGHKSKREAILQISST